ncbi:TraM recognition domain-containing protein (plasmid) [Rathayibacter sp. VKM Ac-2803]|uniref:type IV secretory system conjugative DNA transfer family protein n=1 Tax=Rathayibacter sp. VKM Ac-2803 TaxID=2609256 RepID=UPI001357B079|nr:TraM recognition domain-containing protein [Rathayibacter sp. VKM Ac-2803]MWV51583.1 TraM recognition domain-containing protein [Rathayibacter sp. VKM Ac-2803]
MSTTTNNRRREPGKAGNETLMLVSAVGAIIAIVGFAVAMKLGSDMDGVNAGITGDPFAMIEGLRKGTYTWPSSGTTIAIVFGIGLVLLGVWVLWMKSMMSRGASRADHAARHMASVKEMQGMQLKAATSTSARLGVTGNPGIPTGAMVLATKKTLYSSFEDMGILIAGPRVGKSTSLVIPALTAAPGAVVTTSNKRDVLDATRDLRAQVGDVWVFDPQKVALEEPTWWWNPLTYVTDDTKAAKLAQHFASSVTSAGAKTDAYFEGKGQNLLAAFFLAAAIGNRPITDVYDWLTNVARTDALDYLEEAGYARQADQIRSVQRGAEKPRDSIYSSAERMAACLNNTTIEPWVNPRPVDPDAASSGRLVAAEDAGDSSTQVAAVDAEDGGTTATAVRPKPVDPRRQFNPHEFVKSSGTLYSLSMEGAGNATALVTALTAATIEAAEELATASPGGRLKSPLLGLLDEAANVCRWSDLPDLYSHFGSRGIPIMSVYQSWSQGVAVYGQEGMKKLWSAANTKLYAGGVSDPEFLGMLSDLIGTFDRETTSVSMNKGVRSTTSSLKREKILEVQELADLPRGRAIMLSSGNRAVMLKTVPWYNGPKATVEAIKASIAAHQPGSAKGK